MIRFTPIILVIAAILVFFFYISPQFEASKDLGDRVGELKQSLEQAQDLQTIRSAKLAEFNQFPENEKKKLEVMIASRPDKARIFNTISKIASQNGVSIEEVVFKGEQDNSRSRRGQAEEVASVAGTNLQEVKVGFSVQGTYTNFESFVSDIETNLQIMDITSIKAGQSGSVGGGQLYNVELTTYALK